MSNGFSEKESRALINESLIKIRQLKESIKKTDEPIAIIGMACRFPGHANTPNAFWELLKNGLDGITDIPLNRFDVDEYYDPEHGKSNKIITKKGAFIDNIELFDADFFGISPIEAETMDPQQRLLLHVVWEALESAGIAPSTLINSLTGVFIGVSSNEYGALIQKNNGVISPYFASGNALNALSGRISYTYGLQGPSLIIDTACSSSLVSLHTACKSLQVGDCNLALAGGANVLLDPASYISLSAGQMLSPDGHCKTFDDSADGYARGEGIGLVILKRLSEALRDNNRIFAVIKGSAVNQDGSSSGLTVPNGVAQASLIKEALRHAKVDPLDVSYIEAHGTGTSLGDPIEVNAISEIYGGDRTSQNSLWIGSVKSNIGHLESAAGMSSIIKVILSLNQKELPGNLNFNKLNTKINLESIPAEIVSKNTPWTVKEGKKRIAGISGFGFTGTSAHFILEEPPAFDRSESSVTKSEYLFILSAKSKSALEHWVSSYIKFLELTNESLIDISYSAAVGRNHEGFRLAVIAKDVAELNSKLQHHEFVITEIQNDDPFIITIRTVEEGGYVLNEINKNQFEISIGPLTNWTELLKILESFYLQGADINWSVLTGPNKIIDLPTYPFDYKSVWSEFAKPRNSNTVTNVKKHPFLSRKLDTPELKNIIYESDIDFHWPEFVSHHLIYGSPVIAGAGYISALFSVIEDLNNQGGGVISDLNWIRPLVFSKGELCRLQIILHQDEGENSTTFEVISRNESVNDAEWITHATGVLHLINKYDQTDFIKEPINEIIGRLKTHYLGDDIYNTVPQQISLDLGTHFRWIEELYLSSDELLAKMRLPENNSEINNYVLYPGFIDSVFQTGFGYMYLSEQIDILSIPLLLTEAWYDKTKGYPRWVHSHRSEVNGEFREDFVLLNESGDRVGEFKGFRTKAIGKDALLRAQGTDPDRLLYETLWEEYNTKELIDLSGHWLALGDGPKFDDMIRLLKTYDGKITQVKKQDLPQTQDEYDSLLKKAHNEMPLRGILHLASTDFFEMDSSEQISMAQQFGVKSVLHLIQALAHQKELSNLPLMLITRQTTSFHQSVNVAQSPLNGLFKTILIEQPEIEIKQVDIPADINSHMLLQAISLTLSSSEKLVALDQEKAYVPRLFRSRVARQMRHETIEESSLNDNIKSDATYLITGGLGGLGIALAEHLAEHGAGQIILTGRKGLDNDILHHLKEIKCNTTIISYISLDVGNEHSVADLLDQLGNDKKPLRGIFHLAGVLDDATLMEQSWAHFETVFRPKVYGSFYLHKYSKNLDMFVMFSSMSSTFGTLGQSNYSAANAFMDALCYYRKQLGLAALSLSWGPWAEVGMAKNLVTLHAKSGILGIKPSEGMLALDIALSLSRAHISIVDVNWPIYINKLVNIPSWLEGYTQNKSDSDLLVTQLELVETSERMDLIKKFIAEKVRSIFGIPSFQQVDETRGFFDMGMDSLMAVELKNQLQAGIGKEGLLGVTAVFDYPNIEKIANHLFELLHVDKRPSPKPKNTVIKNVSEESIAIIGMSCRFPGGANSPDDYWNILSESKNVHSEIPTDRWLANEYYNQNRELEEKMYVKSGHFLNNSIYEFDHEFFHISLDEAECMDPQQRLLLEVSWEAFENAGIDPLTLKGSQTGIFVGMMTQDYHNIRDRTGGLKSINRFSGLGDDFLGGPGRLSYFYSTRGPSEPVLTACSSSLVATHLALTSLQRGESDLALAGGVNLILDPATMISFCKMGLLSPDGLCKTFDAKANGYGRGEGIGFVVLKRLSDAQRDNDKILAIISGSAMNHNGESSGLTVPSGQAQQELYNTALKRANITPELVSFIETHGTGTSVGDPIETGSISKVYGGIPRSTPLWIGAVKSNIGHLEGAAGIAGLIKAVLCLQHHQIPGQMHFQNINPAIDLDSILAQIPTQLVSWEGVNGRHIAAVSSFGATGVNAHLILQEAPEPISSIDADIQEPTPYLLTLAAKTEKALQELVVSYQSYLKTNDNKLSDVVYSANIGRTNFGGFGCRLALIASNKEELIEKLSQGQFKSSMIEGEKEQLVSFEYNKQGGFVINETVKNSILITIGPEANWLELLDYMSQKFVSGAKIDWQKFYEPYLRQRVYLPNYPFLDNTFLNNHYTKSMDSNELNDLNYIVPSSNQLIELLTNLKNGLLSVNKLSSWLKLKD